MTDALIGAFAGAFFGALFALFGALYHERRNERRRTTQQFIDEFFSAQFLQHRIATSTLRRRLLTGEVQIDEVARGYWFPGIEEASYAGPLLGEFNEHQHLEAYLGYVVRLAQAFRNQRVDVPIIRSALRTSYLWHGDLLNLLARAVRAQVSAHGHAEVPIWVDDLRSVNLILNYSHDKQGVLGKNEQEGA